MKHTATVNIWIIRLNKRFKIYKFLGLFWTELKSVASWIPKWNLFGWCGTTRTANWPLTSPMYTPFTRMAMVREVLPIFFRVVVGWECRGSSQNSTLNNGKLHEHTIDYIYIANLNQSSSCDGDTNSWVRKDLSHSWPNINMLNRVKENYEH